MDLATDTAVSSASAATAAAAAQSPRHEVFAHDAAGAAAPGSGGGGGNNDLAELLRAPPPLHMCRRAGALETSRMLLAGLDASRADMAALGQVRVVCVCAFVLPARRLAYGIPQKALDQLAAQ